MTARIALLGDTLLGGDAHPCSMIGVMATPSQRSGTSGRTPTSWWRTTRQRSRSGPAGADRAFLQTLYAHGAAAPEC